MTLRIHRTHTPDVLIYQGSPLATLWFEVDGHVFGVTEHRWDHGPQWEVFHAATVGTVADDYDRLRDVRRRGEDDARMFLLDLAADG